MRDISLRLLRPGAQAEVVELFAHGQARDAHPAGGLGLVTVSEFDGLGEKLAVGGFEKDGADVFDFVAGGGGEQFGDVAGQRVIGRGRVREGEVSAWWISSGPMA